MPKCNNFNERWLIENRSQTPLTDSNVICAFHRYSFGIGWKQPKRCQHPGHQFKNGVKSPSIRTIPQETLAIFNETNSPLPVGSAFCIKHLKASTASLRDDDDEPIQITPTKSSTPIEENYTPHTPLISDEAIDEATSIASTLCNALTASPLSFQVKKKRIEDLTESTKSNIRSKFKRVRSQFERRFAEAIAPGQADELISNILHDDEDSDDDPGAVPEELVIPLQMFEESDSYGKVLILAVIDHSKYTKQFLMKIFNCKRYQIDRARNLQKEKAGLSLPKTEQIYRDRMPSEKIEHFLEFLFSRGLLQDVAYGVNKIKFDNGEQQKVSSAILLMKYSHTIAFYKEICQETGYVPMSDTSLWRILHSIKPSQRKALAGLDDITAAGMNGFKMLHGIAEKWKYSDVSKSLEKGKRYLKSNYPERCSMNSQIRSHSTSFALSDAADPDLNQTFDNQGDCADCTDLISSLNKIKDVVSQSNDDDLLYDTSIAIADVENYMKHQIRDAQQKLAKAMAFDLLEQNENGFWLKDFCQKILPAKFREGQKDYFGKKGMTLHVDVFLVKVDGVLRKKVYFTAVYRCEQGLTDSLCLAEVVLAKIREDFPAVKNIYAKSDNASSYHGN